MKKAISLLLSIVMIFSITAGLDFSAYAATGIETKISNIKAKYPNASYFSKNGKACGHGQSYVCSNCQLSNISSSASKVCGDGYTCWAFANYAFYTIFGIAPSNSGNSKKTVNASDLNKNAKYGDYVISLNSSGSKIHYFIYLGANGSNHYRYESNYGVANKVAYKSNNKSTGYNNTTAKYTIIHAKNYDSVNGTSTSKITFNANGGTASASSLTVDVGKTMGSSIPTATRYGYVFDGWYTSASGGTKYTNSTKITTGNKNLYAHWISNSTYGICGNLKVGHIYRIVNKKSGYALQPDYDGDGAPVKQQPISNSYRQLWTVGVGGGCIFNNAYGNKCLDIRRSSLDNGAELLTFGYDDNSQDNRVFTIIPREAGYFSIHPNHSGRALDIRDASTSAGAQVQQYYYTGGAQQLFRFEEVTNRTVTFYDNLNNNYLPSPREVYNYSGSKEPKNCYVSRNTDYVETYVEPAQNKLVIVQKKAGSSGNDMTWSTTVNGSFNYDLYDANTTTMYLGFTAKSSVSGAKMYIRWGYESDSYKTVTLSTTPTNYLIEMPRTHNSGSNIHPYIDSACTVEISNLQLKSDPYSSVSFNYGDSFNGNQINYNINDNEYEMFGYLPTPSTRKEGCIFGGWYTDRIGGTKVTEGTQLLFNTKLYAHWVVATDDNHTHDYVYKNTQNATLEQNGKKVYSCTICGREKNVVIYRPSKITLSKSTFVYNGKAKKPTVKVVDSNGKTISASNYTVSYAKGRTNVGKYSVKITFKGNYIGSKTLYFTIKPKATSIVSLSAKTKGFVVKWNKRTKQTTGYQIQYSTSSKFNNPKTYTISKNSTTSKGFYKLSAKKKYFVRVRTYKVVNGKKYYSTWSSAKSVRTK